MKMLVTLLCLVSVSAFGSETFVVKNDGEWFLSDASGFTSVTEGSSGLYLYTNAGSGYNFKKSKNLNQKVNISLFSYPANGYVLVKFTKAYNYGTSGDDWGQTISPSDLSDGTWVWVGPVTSTSIPSAPSSTYDKNYDPGHNH